jgi:hypothetical protein
MGKRGVQIGVEMYMNGKTGMKMPVCTCLKSIYCL